MGTTLSIETKRWPLREPFVISRGTETEAMGVVVTLVDENRRRGQGEGCGVNYLGETPEGMLAQIEAVRKPIERGVDREALLTLLPPGGARCAVDAALWDLEAKRSGQSVFTLAGLAKPEPVHTVYTIGMRSIPEYEAAAREHATFQCLKIKVNDSDPIGAVRAAHKGAPKTTFIVDPNQAWSVDALQQFAPQLLELGVVLLEQPIKVGDESNLDGYRCPIKICADELINDIHDLEKAKGRFDVINIKLDKAGGLTAALRLADAARAAGFELMVGCMVGSSLSMAPATVLAQQCAFVDLDGPLLLAEDWPDSLRYLDDTIELPDPTFWG